MATILTWQPPRLLTRAEAAKILGVQPVTVTRLERAGRLQAVRAPSGHLAVCGQPASERAA